MKGGDNLLDIVIDYFHGITKFDTSAGASLSGDEGGFCDQIYEALAGGLVGTSIGNQTLSGVKSWFLRGDELFCSIDLFAYHRDDEDHKNSEDGDGEKGTETEVTGHDYPLFGWN
ncbi:MAG: hypothetical protein H9W81_16520 [Enterococcus sp.]|nr:hypothetical protein [Enterococcus sp.]